MKIKNSEHKLNIRSNSPSEKFQTANLARCMYTMLMVVVFYNFQLPWIVAIGSIHLVFAIVWFL
ncbi:Hypothetical protein LEPBI_I1082 [Leptospira biflexa serovar Patoc strain 'Patoc 1 (Paris)']|jgi:hypothetical protein|uniref:Uncharacterized protein n=1 Tax=Leptospira biflexa serovar Patoc (strain Patoc 1 / ATCC 23582 / Paris) TaxID=456481 RepID=B0SN16_LEPBP|nr:Hypothetical protein LEPBI_I1082 [Leptospira biflexa serovar Patoc strain 'Patoc 1 (Paris)']